MTISRSPIFLGLFLILNALFFVCIFDRFEDIVSCCDANSYLKGGDKLFSKGLLFSNSYSGYRSILNYAVAGVIESLGRPLATLVDRGDSAQYAYALAAIGIYTVTATALVVCFGTKLGFAPLFGAIYLNPVSLAYLVYPLQESQMVLLLGPVIVVIVLSLAEQKWARSAILLWVFAAIAWMVKGALILVCVPVVLLAGYIGLRRARSWKPSVIGVALALAVVFPQSYVAWTKFSSIYPYPDSSNFEQQLVWGYSAWRYQTVFDGQWTGYFASNIYPPIATAEEYFARLISSPIEVLSLWIGHTFSAFNFSQLKVYVIDADYGFSIVNIPVGIILFIGFLKWIGKVTRGPYQLCDCFTDSIMIGTIAILPFIAVETRFSYLPFVMISYRAAQYTTVFKENQLRFQELTYSILFGFLFAFAMTLVDTTTMVSK